MGAGWGGGGWVCVFVCVFVCVCGGWGGGGGGGHEVTVGGGYEGDLSFVAWFSHAVRFKVCVGFPCAHPLYTLCVGLNLRYLSPKAIAAIAAIHLLCKICKTLQSPFCKIQHFLRHLCLGISEK